MTTQDVEEAFEVRDDLIEEDDPYYDNVERAQIDLVDEALSNNAD